MNLIFKAADEELMDIKCFDCSGNDYDDCSTSDVFLGDSQSCKGWCQKITKRENALATRICSS